MDEDFQKEQIEEYIILKDKMFFAKFQEGQETRFGGQMSYSEFIKEFNSCVLHWKERGVSPFRFSYVITLQTRHRIIRKE